MSTNTIARAWKDAEFRASLRADESAAIPANPAGTIELPDEALSEVNGGRSFLSFCRTECGFYCTITKEFNCITT